MILTDSRCPLFRDHAPAIEKPRSFSGGASVQQTRSFDYARTSPKALGGFVVFVVVFAANVMARTYAGEIGPRQRKIGLSKVESGIIVAP
jgi:hypothetical protein